MSKQTDNSNFDLEYEFIEQNYKYMRLMAENRVLRMEALYPKEYRTESQQADIDEVKGFVDAYTTLLHRHALCKK